jgi:hypothetical protein
MALPRVETIRSVSREVCLLTKNCEIIHNEIDKSRRKEKQMQLGLSGLPKGNT